MYAFCTNHYDYLCLCSYHIIGFSMKLKDKPNGRQWILLSCYMFKWRGVSNQEGDSVAHDQKLIRPREFHIECIHQLNQMTCERGKVWKPSKYDEHMKTERIDEWMDWWMDQWKRHFISPLHLHGWGKNIQCLKKTVNSPPSTRGNYPAESHLTNHDSAKHQLDLAWLSLGHQGTDKFTREPFYYHGLTLIAVWISNHIHCKVWDEISCPSPNFNNTTVVYI